MVADAAPEPPDLGTYTVTSIAPIGNGLWQLSIVLPNGSTCRVTLSFNNLTLQNVILCAEAAGTLAMTHNGATPVARPFG